MHIKFVGALMMALLAGSALAEQKPYTNTRSLGPTLAMEATLAAATRCAQDGYQVAVAVVDRSGNLQAFLRNPLAGAHTVDVSITKAKTAASFKTSTMEMMNNPRLKQLNYASGVLLIGGGIPIRIGGHFYGGIGVSGAPGEKMSGDVDHACAEAGIAAISEALEFAD
jgi:uncharacterized protein GlcG (DUF336 family)